MRSRKSIGTCFEKKAYNYLKQRFSKVIWLSKLDSRSVIDFAVYTQGGRRLLIEAKYTSKQKPTIRRSQVIYADAVIYKIGKGKIQLIFRKDIIKELKIIDDKEISYFSDPDYILAFSKLKNKSIGRFRPIIKARNKYAILLANQDLKDMDWKEGQFINLDKLGDKQ